MGILDELKKYWSRQTPNYQVMIARDSLTLFNGRSPMERGLVGYKTIFLAS